MQITTDNRDLAHVHIDTYQMLTGESAEESEREYLKDNGREDWDTVDIEYNHAKIVEDFARESINYLIHELTTEKPQIVQYIEYVSSGSPKYYNYTTDGYVMNVTVNIQELKKYIANNAEGVKAKHEGYDNPNDNSTYMHAGLCHYIDATITADDYNMHMWEKEHEIYYENMTIAESK